MIEHRQPQPGLCRALQIRLVIKQQMERTSREGVAGGDAVVLGVVGLARGGGDDAQVGEGLERGIAGFAAAVGVIAEEGAARSSATSIITFPVTICNFLTLSRLEWAKSTNPYRNGQEQIPAPNAKFRPFCISPYPTGVSPQPIVVAPQHG
ncbi:MAG: hypothetical protein DI537_62115 [Stutzerimonas stutzeri]|nr:MAG: hypothetical protein DI537_62115 [Stutzerimonas stutzeri]